MNFKDKKAFSALKFIAILALACTTVLWIGLWCSSSTPTKQTTADTDIIAGSLNNRFDMDAQFNANLKTENLQISAYSDGYLFNGKIAQTKVWFYPQKTPDRDVEYSIADESVATIDQNGVITAKKEGGTKVVACLKSNPDIYAFAYITCYGEEPSQNTTISLPDIKVGETEYLRINDGKTSTSVATISSSNPNVAFANGNFVSGVNEGEATITATFENGSTATTTITIAPNPDFVRPTSLTLKDVDFDFIFDQSYKKSSIVNVANSNDVYVVNDDNIVVDRGSGIGIWGTGKTTVTFISRYNPDARVSMTLLAKKQPPKEFRVYIPDTAIPYTSTYCSASHMPFAYNNDVKWEVVSGKATISPNGVFYATMYGDCVVRCTSTLDPSFTYEKTVHVKLFNSTYNFVRKLMGHMGLSAVLGFGLFFCFALLPRKKWTCVVFPPVLSLLHAFISEGIQSFVPGRTCAITDVLVDFMGGVAGIAIGMLLFVSVVLILQICGKSRYNRFTYCMSNLNLKSAFSKTYVMNEPYVKE